MAFSLRCVATTFADELFFYTLNRRLYVISVSPGICLPFERLEFSPEVGKAILIVLHNNQPGFRQQLRADFLQFVINRQTFISYVTQNAFRIFNTGHNIFQALLEMSAFLVESIAYCFECGVRDYFEIIQMCWVDIFLQRYSRVFFLKGGWIEFRIFCLPLSYIYDSKGIEGHFNGIVNSYNISWLMHNDEEPLERELTSTQQEPFQTKYATFCGWPASGVPDEGLGALNNPLHTPPSTPSPQDSAFDSPGSATRNLQLEPSPPDNSSNPDLHDERANAVGAPANDIYIPLLMPIYDAYSQQQAMNSSHKTDGTNNFGSNLVIPAQFQCPHSDNSYQISSTQVSGSENPLPMDHPDFKEKTQETGQSHVNSRNACCSLSQVDSDESSSSNFSSRSFNGISRSNFYGNRKKRGNKSKSSRIRAWSESAATLDSRSDSKKVSSGEIENITDPEMISHLRITNATSNDTHCATANVECNKNTNTETANEEIISASLSANVENANKKTANEDISASFPADSSKMA